MTPYYQDNLVTLYHGDCCEVMQLLPAADHVITDPPYESEAHTLQRRVKRSGGIMNVEPLTFQPVSPELRSASSKEIARLTRRWCLIFCQVEAAMEWRASLEVNGFVYRRTGVWIKPDGMPQYSGDRPGMGYESIVIAHAKGKSVWNGGGRHGVFIHNKNEGNGKAPHPTMKPESLMSELINLFTDEGEIILDPFMGSGTTLIAAKKAGRRAIGIDVDEGYCKVAAKRLEISQPALFTMPTRTLQEQETVFT